MPPRSEPSLARQIFLVGRSTVFLLPWLLQLSLADIVLSSLLPISPLFPNLCYDVSSRVAASVWHAVQLIFTRINGAKIIVSGADKLPSDESAIVISNHVEWTDFYMIQELAIRTGMLGRCRYFAKKPLRWVPLLGWGLWAMGMPLVSRKWMTDQREMDRVFHGVLQRKWPMWLISYSEATRYTAKKRLEAEAWCRANNKRIGQHTLYPRTKGFIACVQKLRHAPQMKAVYDITVAYAKDNKIFQQPPSFMQTLIRPHLDREWTFFVHVDRYAIADLPNDDEKLAQWLENVWVEKGERLELLHQRLQKGLPWTPL